MAEKRTSFLFYKSWITPIRKLKDEDAGLLMINIFNYVNDEHIDYMPDDVLNMFNMIIHQIELDWAKWNPLTRKYHWNYKGGITKENHKIRNSWEYQQWRLKVFTRDDYTCNNCGFTGGVLNAHHIKEFSKYPELRLDVTNGSTLCKSCHIKVHRL